MRIVTDRYGRTWADSGLGNVPLTGQRFGLGQEVCKTQCPQGYFLDYGNSLCCVIHSGVQSCSGPPKTVCTETRDPGDLDAAAAQLKADLGPITQAAEFGATLMIGPIAGAVSGAVGKGLSAVRAFFR